MVDSKMMIELAAYTGKEVTDEFVEDVTKVYNDHKALTAKVKQFVAAWEKFDSSMVMLVEELKFMVKDAPQ